MPRFEILMKEPDGKTGKQLVEADDFDIRDGVLYFMKDGSIITAFAKDFWLQFRRVGGQSSRPAVMAMGHGWMRRAR